MSKYPYNLPPWDQVREKSEAITIPYIYKLEQGQQQLVYVGISHGHDLDGPCAVGIINEWEEFTNKHSASHTKTVVLVEGGLRPVEEDMETAIKLHSEFGLVAYLAHHSSIEVLNADAPRAIQYQELLNRGYSRDEVQYFFFMQMVHQFVHMPEGFQPGFLDYIVKILDRDRRSSKWEDYDFSLENMLRLHIAYTGKPFAITDFKLFEELMNPNLQDNTTQRIKRELIYIRDNHVVEEVSKQWRARKSIFIVFGATHALIQERAIRKIVEVGV